MKKKELKAIIRNKQREIDYLLNKYAELESDYNDLVENHLRSNENFIKVAEIACDWATDYLNIKKRCAIHPKKCYTDGIKTTVVQWSDGSVTKTTCGEGETFDAEKGFFACVAKRALSSKEYSTIVGKKNEFPIVNNKSDEEVPFSDHEVKKVITKKPVRTRKFRKVPEELLERALNDYKNNALTYKEAASKYGFSADSLRNYAAKKRQTEGA